MRDFIQLNKFKKKWFNMKKKKQIGRDLYTSFFFAKRTGKKLQAKKIVF